MLDREGSITRLSSLDVDIRSISFLEILEKISKKKSVQAKKVIDEIESI